MSGRAAGNGRLGVRCALVGDVMVPGDVRIEDGRVAAVGVLPAGAGGVAAPGFVDLQVNGYGGVDFLTTDPPGYRRAGETLLAAGVTTYLPTLITSPEATIRAAMTVVAEAMSATGGPRIPGVHLEGPFLSSCYPGIHEPAFLRRPDLGFVERMASIAPVALVTLAPELPDALDLIGALAARGIAVSCGHSDADAATAHAAFDAGARAITHLHNAHRPVGHRDPGLGGVALVRADVMVQAIVDHVHLAPEIAYAAFLAARGRFCIVTDAMVAAGMGDGHYRFGTREITVSDAVAQVAGGRIAGSVLPLDGAVRNLVAMGSSEIDAILAVTRAPARVLGRRDLGVLAVGAPADVTILDDRLDVRATFIGGRQLHRA